MKASDISSSMAKESQRRYEAAISEGAQPPAAVPQFFTSDLASLSGSYDVVTCLDVMIHYPQASMIMSLDTFSPIITAVREYTTPGYLFRDIKWQRYHDDSDVLPSLSTDADG